MKTLRQMFTYTALVYVWFKHILTSLTNFIGIPIITSMGMLLIDESE
jgi:hypothetical protein